MSRRRTDAREVATLSGTAHAKQRHTAMTVLILALLVAVIGGVSAHLLLARQSQATYVPANPHTAVLTYRNDNSRVGWNQVETKLTVKTVRSSKFGLRVTYPVDGQVYAQPLYVPNLSVHGSLHNVVVVATQHDSVYAFDADATTTQSPLWHTSFLSAGVTSVNYSDVFAPGSEAIYPEVGITSTPVVDPATDTLYTVALTKANSTLAYHLYALDLHSGKLLRSTPITAAVGGKGVGSANGLVTFDPRYELQRAALLLVNGMVYIATASYGDQEPFHGWLFAYDGATLKQMAVLCTSPDGSNAGIWSSGGGLAATSDGGMIYAVTGDGSFDLDVGGRDLGNSVLELSPYLTLLDYFTPDLQSYFTKFDLDLGSSGLILISPTPAATVSATPSTTPSATATPTPSKPLPPLAILSSKDGHVYVLNQHSLGAFHRYPDYIQQELPGGTVTSAFATPAYWSSSQGDFVYLTGVNDTLKAFSLVNDKLSAKPVSQTAEKFKYPGGEPAISSNGGKAGTGIVWLVTAGTTKGRVQSGALRAFDASDVSQQLFEAPIPQFVKFSVPTVANGRVFVGTGTSLQVYGLGG